MNFGGTDSGPAKLREQGFNMTPIHVEHVETVGLCDSFRLSPGRSFGIPHEKLQSTQGGGEAHYNGSNLNRYNAFGARGRSCR